MKPRSVIVPLVDGRKPHYHHVGDGRFHEFAYYGVRQFVYDYGVRQFVYDEHHSITIRA